MSNPFIDAIDRFDGGLDNTYQVEAEILAVKNRLESRVKDIVRFESGDINDPNLLSILENIESDCKQLFANWAEDIEALAPMKMLSDAYNDRIILLVYGKMNAGKSSFANFLTSLFSEKPQKRFVIKQGKLTELDANTAFEEGNTETTSVLQGVELGNRLVLLDSPGLHTSTDQNAVLTKQYTDSADALLWLTDSSSPAQTQELEDLSDQLKIGKPLFPIITSSDRYEEVISPDGNDLINTIVNKDKEARIAQEKDVLNRLNGLEIKQQIHNPISISVHAYKKSNKGSDEAWVESGMKGLFDSMANIVNEASEYKQKKAQQQVVNFLELQTKSENLANMMGSVHELNDYLSTLIKDIDRGRDSMQSSVRAKLLPELDRIVDRHKSTKDINAVVLETSALVNHTISHEFGNKLSAFDNKISLMDVHLDSSSLGAYKDKTTKVEREVGRTRVNTGEYTETGVDKKLTTAAGTAIGTAIGGPVGAAVGGVIGSLFGGKERHAIMDEQIQTEWMDKVIGVDTQDVLRSLKDSVSDELSSAINAGVDEVVSYLEVVKNIASQLISATEDFHQDIKNIRDEMHPNLA